MRQPQAVISAFRLAASTAALLLACAAPAQQGGGRNVSGGELIAEQACFDVLHYELRLEVQPGERALQGWMTMRARAVTPCRQIVLDLDRALDVMDASVAMGDGKFADVEFERDIPLQNLLNLSRIDHGLLPEFVNLPI